MNEVAKSNNTSMENVMKMAGSYTAHAIWSVSSGEVLIPIVGVLKTDESTSMNRLAMGSVEAMSTGESMLSNLSSDAQGAAFIKDGLITLDTGKTDALIVDIRFACNTGAKVQVLVPYRNANHEDGFAVHRMKITELEGISVETAEGLANHFFDGADSHKQGGKLWSDQYVEEAGVSDEHAGVESTSFSPEDFEQLKKAPLLVFFLVAAADGKVDKKEMVVFAKLMSDSTNLTSPLLIRIVTNVINEMPARITDMATQNTDFPAELVSIGKIIDQNMTDAEANEFKSSLLKLGLDIARASGGWFGIGSKIDKNESAAIALIALCLGTVPGDLSRD